MVAPVWLSEILLASPLKPLNGIQWNDRNQDLNVLYQVCDIWAGRKTKMAPGLISWYIFYFSSETAERYSVKINRKQDLNLLFQVCIFRADRKTNMAARPLICWY